MVKTKKNLLDAFAGESQANRKYTAFAKQAEKEGLLQVAKLFRAVAEAETIHAHALLRQAGKIGGTMENLKDAIGGEEYEHTSMYPTMIADAEQEGEKAAARYMGWVSEVEKIHSGLYQKALDAQGQVADTDYYICAVCGYTHEGPHEGDCPVCKAKPTAFYKMAS